VLNPYYLHPGQGQYKEFFSRIMQRYLYHYDYRDYDGKLYSGMGVTLDDARENALREKWNKQCVTVS